MPDYAAISQKKFLDAAGLTYFSQKLNNYPTNDVIAAVIDGVQDALDQKEYKIQHKTAEEWVYDTVYVPRVGEIVIYDKDETHDYARMKVGDGSSLVAQLPFLDAGTINGKTIEPVVLRYRSYDQFPPIGSTGSLYFDEQNNALYCWVNSSGYVKISFASNEYRTITLLTVRSFDPGEMTTLTASDGVLNVVNGRIPSLATVESAVLTRNV